MTQTSLRWVVAAVLVTVHSLASAGIVCWTDDQGRRACGDRVPPEYSKKERKVYDDEGRVVETRERQRSAEEFARERAQTQQAEQDAVRDAEQRRYDRFLMQTYASIDELIRARDDRLAIIDGRMSLAEKNQAAMTSQVENLMDKARPIVKKGKDLPEKLRRQIDSYETSLRDANQAVTLLREEREKVESTFERDIARYRELKGAAESGAQQVRTETK